MVVEIEEVETETFCFVSDAEFCDPGAVSKPRLETTGAGEFLLSNSYMNVIKAVKLYKS